MSPAADVEYWPGFGVSGTVNGRRYRLGSARYCGIAREPGDSTQRVYLADDERGVLARFDLADVPRPRAKDALATLSERARLVLVSGDDAPAVTRTARDLGLTEFHSGLRPEDKLELLRSLQSTGAVVAAVGDGINDAPLLAQADVSIALVAGSQLAQASADVVFTGSDLRVLARLPAWASTVRRTVRQNLAWSMGYNLAAVPLAASGILSPWMAAIGMSLSSLLVVANALRLNRALEGGAQRMPAARRALRERAVA